MSFMPTSSAPRSRSSPPSGDPQWKPSGIGWAGGPRPRLRHVLKRFWRDLGIRAQGDPAALTRLPAEITEAVEALWQKSLALAAQSAQHDDNGARERLDRIRIENEVRAQSFELRERAYETAARERERALADTRDHLLSTLRMLESDRVTLSVRDARIAELEAQVEGHRQQLARLIARAVAKSRALIKPKSLPARSSKSKPQSKPRRLSRKAPRTPRPRHRTRR